MERCRRNYKHLPMPDCLNSAQHLQPRCLEDRFSLIKLEKSTADAHITSAHHVPPSGSPQTAKQLTSPGTGDPLTSDSLELSLQVPRLQGNFPRACPNCFAPQRPSSSSEENLSSMRSSHMVRDAPAKGQTSQNASDSGNTAAKHHTSLTADEWVGPHICSVRFSASCQTSRRAPQVN